MAIFRLPSNTTIIIAATIGAIAISIPFRLQARLSALITHTSNSGASALTLIKSSPNSSAPAKHSPVPPLPGSVLSEPSNFRIVHDSAMLPIPSSQLPQPLSPQLLLTTYLRHTMLRFSRLPQAYTIYLLTPSEHRHTFSKSYLEKVEFQQGDVVNGMYRILSNEPVKCEGRTGWRIVLAMELNDIAGRLVISMMPSPEKLNNEAGEWREGEVSVDFQTETWMWVPRDSKSSMPIESAVVKWLHELTRWWLIEKGTEYLQEIKESWKKWHRSDW